MLRHKAFIQAVRLAFSLSEAVDDDEARRMGAREPDYHVVEERPEPARERTPPTEVKAPEPSEETTEEAAAPEPAEETTEEAAPGESEEARHTKASLLEEWRGMLRTGWSAEEVDEVRKFAGVSLIDTTCTLAQLEAVVHKASEIAERRRERRNDV